jgi:hypothetical protein
LESKYFAIKLKLSALVTSLSTTEVLDVLFNLIELSAANEEILQESDNSKIIKKVSSIFSIFIIKN